jgi:hypothetical protein
MHVKGQDAAVYFSQFLAAKWPPVVFTDSVAFIWLSGCCLHQRQRSCGAIQRQRSPGQSQLRPFQGNNVSLSTRQAASLPCRQQSADRKVRQVH